MPNFTKSNIRRYSIDFSCYKTFNFINDNSIFNNNCFKNSVLDPINEKDFELIFNYPFKDEVDCSDENIYADVLLVDESNNRSSDAQLCLSGSTELFGKEDDFISTIS